jgi:hypothetical protein
VCPRITHPYPSPIPVAQRPIRRINEWSVFVWGLRRVSMEVKHIDDHGREDGRDFICTLRHITIRSRWKEPKH